MDLRITGGEFRGRRVRTIGTSALRPTTDRTRSAIFSILGLDKLIGSKVLDLYAGTGALGIEALSRGADWADFVELDKSLARRLEENLQMLGVEHYSDVFQGRVERVINELTKKYDVVFADPPYRDSNYENLMGVIVAGDILKESSIVIIEHDKDTKLNESHGSLFLTKQRHYGDSGISIFTSKVPND